MVALVLSADSTGRIRVPAERESRIPINISATSTADDDSTESASVTFGFARLYKGPEGLSFIGLEGAVHAGARVDFLVAGICYANDGRIIETVSEKLAVRGRWGPSDNDRYDHHMNFQLVPSAGVPEWFEISINARRLSAEEKEVEAEADLFDDMVERPRPGMLVIKMETVSDGGDVVWDYRPMARIFDDVTDGTDSFEYRYAGAVDFIPFHKIRYIDGRDYEHLILLNRNDGTQIYIQGEPVLSPDKSRFVSYTHSTFRNILEIWKLENAKPALEYSVDFEDLKIGLCAFDCKWVGDDAVLFNWKEPDRPLWDQSNQPEQQLEPLPGAILLQPEGWTLLNPPTVD